MQIARKQENRPKNLLSYVNTKMTPFNSEQLLPLYKVI